MKAVRQRDRTRSDVVPLAVAVRAWFSISLRTFGGPAGQIAVMHRDLVDERRWVGEQRFLHALSYCTVLPGPEAQQLAIYLGWLLNGTTGGLIAGVLFVLPGYLALMGLSAAYAQWGDTTAVAAIFAGLAPAVLAIVVQAVLRVGKRALKHWTLFAIAVAAFVALAAFRVPFPLVIAVAGFVGFAINLARPQLFAVKPTNADTMAPPLIDDDALHGERPSMARAFKLLLVGLVLLIVPTAVVATVFGRHHVLTEQGLFFTGTAFVTFGGAYAVLSFVAQRAVEVYHWLLPGEMIHGLALAETTPGPLIMVVQFVAFLGAFRNSGDLNPWVAGIMGATLVVWVTFVPCFLLVFLGAPHVEALRSNQKISAALAGITAAVVGVIANLSVYFALHTLFRNTGELDVSALHIEYPVVSTISVRALGICALAFFLTFQRKLSVLWVLGICGVCGAVLHLVA